MRMSISAKAVKSRVIDEMATRSSFSTIKRARYFDFIAANAENPVSHKYDVANGSSTFKACLTKHYIPN